MKQQANIKLIAGLIIASLGMLIILLKCYHFMGGAVDFRIINVTDFLPGVIFFVLGIKWIYRGRQQKHIHSDIK